jgi:DNA-binding protein WhiA
MLSGAFAACGRAGENADGYRIEIPVPNERTLKTVTDGLEEIGITVKTACRRGELLIYLRKRALVEDLLAYIGAQGVSLRISADEAERSVRVVANRQKNCDTTNILRTLSASERQVAAIKAIEENGALDKLPQNLKETAVLRLENPIASLDEITELHEGALSRSGVNHRLAKIIEFAEKNGYIVK